MNDINNPLEEIKVKAVLDSEIRKLEFRKEFKPEDVNILDYTVIVALEKQVTKKVSNKKQSDFLGYTAHCPSCKVTIVSSFNSNVCGNCGQRLDWQREAK